MWHETRYMGYVACDMWNVTCVTEVWEWRCFEDKIKNYRINKWMNDKGICKTSQASPGLLLIRLNFKSHYRLYKSCSMGRSYRTAVESLQLLFPREGLDTCTIGKEKWRFLLYPPGTSGVGDIASGQAMNILYPVLGKHDSESEIRQGCHVGKGLFTNDGLKRGSLNSPPLSQK